VPEEARLRCRLQEPCGGFADALTRRRLTKRSLENAVWAKFAEQAFHTLRWIVY
jgi:hypothetical protein